MTPATARVEAGAPTTRDRIIAVVIDALAELDPAALTIQQICDRAEVRAPTVYYHFGSKDGLIGEAVSVLVADWLTQLEASVDRTGTLEETFAQARDAWAQMITAQSRPFAVFVWLAMWSEPSRDSLVLGRQRAHELIETVLTHQLGALAGIDDVARLVLDGLLGASIDYQLDADADLLGRRLSSLLAVVHAFATAHTITGER